MVKTTDDPGATPCQVTLAVVRGPVSKHQRRVQTRRNREQAVVSFPVLAKLLLPNCVADVPIKEMIGRLPWDLSWLPPADKVAIHKAVDDGDPLLPQLTRIFGAKSWMLQHLTRHEWEYFSWCEGDIRKALSAMRWTTPELAPTESWQLHNLTDASAALESLIDWTRGDNQRAFRRLLDQPRLVHRLVDYMWFLRHLARWVAMKTGAHPMLEQRIGCVTIPEWLELSHRWRKIIDGQALRLFPSGVCPEETSTPAVIWPAMFTGIQHHAGYDFHYVSSRDALIAEARAMNHCVAQYLRAAMDWECHILSVRQGASHVATVEVRENMAVGFHVECAVGASNAALTTRLWNVIEEFVERWNLPSDDNLCVDDAQLTNEEELRGRSLEALATLEYSFAATSFDPVDHFRLLAQTFGAAGFSQYRPCLEFNPGGGTLYDEVLRAAESASGT